MDTRQRRAAAPSRWALMGHRTTGAFTPESCALPTGAAATTSALQSYYACQIRNQRGEEADRQLTVLGGVSTAAAGLFRDVFAVITARLDADVAAAARRATAEAEARRRADAAATTLDAKITAAWDAAGSVDGMLTLASIKAQTGRLQNAVEDLGAAVGRLGAVEGLVLTLPPETPVARRTELRGRISAMRARIAATQGEIVRRLAPLAPPPGEEAPPPPPPLVLPPFVFVRPAATAATEAVVMLTENGTRGEREACEAWREMSPERKRERAEEHVAWARGADRTLFGASELVAAADSACGTPPRRDTTADESGSWWEPLAWLAAGVAAVGGGVALAKRR